MAMMMPGMMPPAPVPEAPQVPVDSYETPPAEEMDRQRSRKLLERRVRHSTPKHDKLIDQFRRHLHHSIEGKRTRNELARQAYMAYRVWFDEAKNKAPVKLKNNYFFAAIQTVVAREMASFIGPNPFVQYSPRTDNETARRKAAAYNASFAYHWRLRKPISEMASLLLQRRLFGDAYAAFYWREEWAPVGDWEDSVQQVPVGVEIDEMGFPAPVTVDVPVREYVVEDAKTVDSPWFDALHFLECYPDWEIPNLQEGRYFIHVTMRSREYIEERMKRGDYIKSNCREALKDSGGHTSSWANDIDTIASWQREVGLHAIEMDDLRENRLYEVAEWYTKEHGCIVIINRRWVVKWTEPNPIFRGRYPIAHLGNQQLPKEHFSMSDWELVRLNVRHSDVMSTCRGTEALMSVFTPLLAKVGVSVPDNLSIGPGKIIRVTNTDDITPLVRPANGIPLAEMEIQSSHNAIDNTLATSDAYRGNVGRSDTKATAITKADEGAGIRLNLGNVLIHEQFVDVVATFYAWMMSALQDSEITVRLTDQIESATVISPEDMSLPGELEIEATGGQNQVKELEVKRLIEYSQMMLNFKVPDFDVREAAKVMGELIVPRYVGRLIRDPKETQEEMMRQQAEQAAAQGPGATPPSGRTGNKANDAGAEELSRDQGAMMRL